MQFEGFKKRCTWKQQIFSFNKYQCQVFGATMQEYYSGYVTGSLKYQGWLFISQTQAFGLGNNSSIYH